MAMTTMSKAKTDALLYYKGELKLKVEVKESGMLDELVLARPLGFLSQYELKSVTAKTDDMERMDKIISFLLGKEDKCFGNFCDILTNCNYEGLANSLRIKAGLTTGAPADSSSQRSEAVPSDDAILTQKVYEHPGYLILFRMHVSRKVADDWMPLLDDVGLEEHTRKTCFADHSEQVESTVQAGLTKWSEGQGKQPPTWHMLLGAMEFAGIAQENIDELKKDLMKPPSVFIDEHTQTPPEEAHPGLSQKVTDRQDYSKLFRIRVSRKAADKGKATLEGVGLDAPTIGACYTTHRKKEEEAVQEGLNKWRGGKGFQPPTWGLLLKAMAYAEIEQQAIQDLKKDLGLP